MNTVDRIFVDINMSLCHKGLTAVAKDHRVSLDKLDPGHFVLFVNVAMTAFKLFGSGNTYVYHRQAHRLHPKALMRAVNCFDGVKFGYQQAVAEELFRKLPRETREAIKAADARKKA